ncbi:MAG TPA: NAD(P)/FAD-dependent oxidoreductase [Actinomycetota bacterium]|nr:NAD(P)/FAD-dependent oxidoreductase [Actinomycetota bacterium]
MAEDRPVEALVVGAGPAGLAAGAMLRRRGVDVLLVDRGGAIGDSWRQHYERLHLHTVRWLSNLPGLPIPRAEGKWVAKEGVVRYLEAYARHAALDVRLGTEVRRLERTGDGWIARTNAGDISARAVIIATGYNRVPVLPPWAGRETFTGELIHSSAYRNPGPYRGKDVLVVGTGNSGAEIAVDLVDGGAARVMISVRTPPNIMRRDIAGFPSQLLGVALRRLPPPVVDRMAAVVRRVAIGDLRPYGLPPPPRGTYTGLREHDRVPILDIGLVRLLKRRQVQVVPAVRAFDGADVVLADGSRLRPDAVIAATGFERGLDDLVGHLGILGPHGRPVVNGPATDPRAADLYFIGFSNPISGNLREVGIDARKIARAIARRRRAVPVPS